MYGHISLAWSASVCVWVGECSHTLGCVQACTTSMDVCKCLHSHTPGCACLHAHLHTHVCVSMYPILLGSVCLCPKHQRVCVGVGVCARTHVVTGLSVCVHSSMPRCAPVHQV